MRSTKPLFRLSIGKKEFAPSLIPTLATVLLFPILLALGMWQLHRAHEKEFLQHYYQLQAHVTPMDLNKVCDFTHNSPYTPVQATGKWDNVHQFLLDNKTHNHVIGYHVITPLLLNDDEAILVDRGWIPANPDRKQLPNLPQILGTATIQGIVQIPQKNIFAMEENNKQNTWPKRVQNIDFKQAAIILQSTVPPFLVLLNPDQNNGFVREWSPIELKPSVNYGYAFQWFALAGALLVIFIVVNVRSREVPDHA